jgi:hypothetical protein
MTTADILHAARALISERARWTKGSIARTGNNHIVSHDDPKAAKWCALGAIYKMADNRHSRQSAIEVLRVCSPSGEVAEYNDRRYVTHADILALYDCAIAKAEGREP